MITVLSSRMSVFLDSGFSNICIISSRLKMEVKMFIDAEFAREFAR